MLIVDDQRGVCVSLSFLLGTAGYKVLTTESGRAALTIFEAETVDGAVIDVHMPGMNGFDACAALQARAAAFGRSLRVWFMTGAFTSVLERRCAEAGGFGVFHKPFDYPALLSQLEAGFSAPIPSPLPALSCVSAHELGSDPP